MSMMEPLTPGGGDPEGGLPEGVDFDDADFEDEDPAAPSVFRTPVVGRGLTEEELQDDLRDEERDDQLGD
ncbi:hypothetical protein [Curtobacterium sp. MCBD17_019]|uniref:hypothetical protein n=1 Tax=Curtobacterium sp. MCBD17_019 TaxID=2175669 RepID=UPI000DA9118E|nr:hypothetical protein [Curtobacterium sp. MCBD17_019]PZE76231.1 hypothetical protein DEI82_07015 [Curtobacterium sp. MCBD17_019]